MNNICTVMNGSPGKGNEINLKQPAVLVLSAMAETGLVSLPSLLTAVLLEANNRSSSDQASAILPSNFEEVATGVLKVLNNVACLDITLLQCMLAKSDLKMEFFHLISFLLSHCMSKWRVPNDQVGFLLLESILLLGYFSLFHAGNQAVLRWGKAPQYSTSDPELMPILAAALTAVCYGCDQYRSVVLQEISSDMLRSLLRSCRASGLVTSDPVAAAADGSGANNSGDSTQISPDTKNSLSDMSTRSNRKGLTTATFATGPLPRSRPVLGKGVSGAVRLNRNKNQKDGRGTRTGDDAPPKQRAGETSSAFICCIGKSRLSSWTGQKSSSAAAHNKSTEYHKLTFTRSSPTRVRVFEEWD